jgi:hypothetical protein
VENDFSLSIAGRKGKWKSAKKHQKAARHGVGIGAGE